MRKKLLKIVKISLAVLAGATALDAAAVFYFAQTSPHVKKADAIIIMGAAINTPALYNRTMEGLRLYEEGDAPVMILSGGRISDKDISEAQYMERVLGKNATKPLNIILEEQSGSTYENIKNSRAKLPEAKSVIVVSDKFHLARSAIMARFMGFSQVYYSAPDSNYYKPAELAFYYLREMAAMVAYVPKFLFTGAK